MSYYYDSCFYLIHLSVSRWNDQQTWKTWWPTLHEHQDRQSTCKYSLNHQRWAMWCVGWYTLLKQSSFDEKWFRLDKSVPAVSTSGVCAAWKSNRMMVQHSNEISVLVTVCHKNDLIYYQIWTFWEMVRAMKNRDWLLFLGFPSGPQKEVFSLLPGFTQREWHQQILAGDSEQECENNNTA